MCHSPLRPLDLQLGWPSKSLLPILELLRATHAVLSNDERNATALQYGPDYGDDVIREHIGQWLTQKYQPMGGKIHADRIFMTNGASGSLASILQKFTDVNYTRRVFIIEPTYFLACQTFQDAGFGPKMQGVPADEEGVDLGFLSDRLNEVETEDADLSAGEHSKDPENNFPKIFKYVMYTVPTFSNPNGTIMSRSRRTDLVKLARRFDILLISDDVYDFLSWPADESVHDAVYDLPPRLVDIDRSLEGANTWGNAVSNGSFSKLTAPGLRIGWCESTPAFINTMSTHGATRSGGCQGQFASFIIDSMLMSGALDRHIQQVLVPTLKARRRCLVEAVNTELIPLGFEVSHGKPFSISLISSMREKVQTDLLGGFFLYLQFPRGRDSSIECAMNLIAGRYCTKIAPGHLFAVMSNSASIVRSRGTFERGMRLSWAWHDGEALIEGVRRLACAWKDSIE